MDALLLEPERCLGSFQAPSGYHQVYVVVSRTGMTVAARLGAVDGRVVARAEGLAASEPTIRFEDLYNANPKQWKTEFKGRFIAALGAALRNMAETSSSANAGGPA